MLQQTQVSRVLPRWHEFIARFPTATSCADASSGDVIALWSGLGYNRRAINLWKSAVAVRDHFGGIMPTAIGELETLPGVGPYTARAVAVFADEQRVGVVDTNVGRLLARWTGIAQSARNAQGLADALVPIDDPWRWNQTLFDFAVAVCTRREPQCSTCPVAVVCAWRGVGTDPADRSAGVSQPQAPFAGSVRQVRGRLVDAVRAGPVSLERLGDFARDGDTEEAVWAIVCGLIDDGLMIERGGRLLLPDS